MAKKSLEDIDLEDKRILMRVDFNVPLKDGLIGDDTRIRAALASIRYVLEQPGTSCVLMSHLGRPKGKFVPSMSLDPVAKRLSELIGRPVRMAPDCVGVETEQMAANQGSGDILMLENVRFHPEEEANDAGFAKQLASIGDVFVNDAFGTAHRAHASTEGVARLLPAVAGFLMEKEIRFLGTLLEDPPTPYVAIIGGAKVSTKIKVLESLLPKVSSLIIGGGMAYTFLKSQGVRVGNSLVEDDHSDTAQRLIQQARSLGKQLVLPQDHLAADTFGENAVAEIVAEGIPEGKIGMDIGPKTLGVCRPIIASARTLVWNGPVGVFEFARFAEGTQEVAKMVSECSGTTVIGGGDVVAAVNEFGLAQKITHVSTGGGASLEFLEGTTLPGIAILEEK